MSLIARAVIYCLKAAAFAGLSAALVKALSYVLTIQGFYFWRFAVAFLVCYLLIDAVNWGYRYRKRL